MAALAAMFCVLSACGGRHHPSRAEVVAKLNATAEVQALKKKDGQDLVFEKEVEDESLYTQSYTHEVNGVQVLGSGVRYHLDQNGDHVSSNLADIPDTLLAKIDVTAALKRAQEIEPTESVAGTPVTRILPPMHNNPARMIYVVALSSGEELWIDAVSGEHVATLEESQHALSAEKNGIILTRLPHDRCSIGTLASERVSEYAKARCQKKIENACEVLNWEMLPISFHPGACKKAAATDASSLRADENTKKFLDYFKETHNRDSFDGRGTPVVSIVHAGDQYANASWFKKDKVMVYGDGDGVTFKDFTFGVDIAAHELTHGVIQSTAGLISLGESGALNESIADYFGKVIEGNDDWNFGRSVYVSSAGDPAIRDLLNPARLNGEFKNSVGTLVTRPYPSSNAEAAPIAEPCLEKNDFCAIHYNATVPGHAWAKIHIALGKDRAEKLIYLALTHYFHELTDFKQAAEGTLSACGALYDEDVCGPVREVFVHSGMM